MTSQLKITGGPEKIERKEEDVGIDDQPTEDSNVDNANVGDTWQPRSPNPGVTISFSICQTSPSVYLQ